MSNNRSNNARKRLLNNFQGTSIFVKVFIGIAILGAIVLAIIWIITVFKTKSKYNQNNPVLLSGEFSADTSLQKNKSYVISNLPTSLNGKLFSYSLWINISDYVTKYGHFKNILSRSNKQSDSDTKINPLNNLNISQSPGIYLDASSSNLLVYTDIIKSESPKFTHDIPCIIPNIPLNKWVHIVYVLNQNSVDLYLNGKLERSCVINGVPYTNNNNKLYIAKDSGFNGKIAQIQYFTKALDPNNVNKLYYNGPSGTNKFIAKNISNPLANVNFSQLKADICSGDNKDLSSLIGKLI